MKLGIDLGGTNIRIAAVDHGEIIKMKSVACPAAGSEQDVLNTIYDLIDEYNTDDVSGLGIGVPSVVNSSLGIVYNVANIPSWKEVHLKKILESRYTFPVAVNNDANCFALGESIYGQGRDFENMVGITLGTGLGAGVIVNHQLYNGFNTGAGEIGSIPFKQSDFEQYCSGAYFPQHFQMSAKQAYEKALQGDNDALKAWESFGVNLGELVKMVMFSYDPQAIIFGGSVAKAFDFYIAGLHKSLSSFPYKESIENINILQSKRDNISLLGAAALL